MIPALIDHLWQSSLFAVGAWLLTLLLRKDGAHARYWVWFAASVKFLIPLSGLALIGQQFRWHATPESVSAPFAYQVQQVAAQFMTPAAVNRSSGQFELDLLWIIFPIWAIGSAALAARWLACWLKVTADVRSAVPTGLTGQVPVMTSPTLHEPGVVGLFRPVLLLPEGLASRLAPKELQSILAHELCHVRRRDNLTAAIHMLVESVFWFHPFVWWIGARLIEERERACDEAVVRSGNERRSYAQGILKVCQFHLASRLPCVAGVSGANIKLRLEVIMKNPVATKLGRGKKTLLGMAALTALALPVIAGMTPSAQARAQVAEASTTSSVETTPVVPGPGKPEARQPSSNHPEVKQAGKIELLEGKRVRLSYRNVEVRSLLQALAHAAHVNMLIHDNVAGTVTVNLADMPWDQALDVVLYAKGLARHEKGGIIFVERAREN